MVDAEQDRTVMTAEIERLERDKQAVQAENVRIIEENRGLLEHLEQLNDAVAESDARIKSLTATLESTQLEARKLMVSSSRVAQMESQIRDMETEQAQLHEKLAVSEEDGISAFQRWRKAEGTLRDLQDQLDRMEKEAREEREKHVELLSRMERRRDVERELDSAAGRLKGAAAVSTLGRDKHKTNVVSNFVRDILEDNANLQVGIVELREMLQNSNEEVHNLREQILLHQPLGSEPEESRTPNQVPLSDELEAKLSGQVSHELHVHHHYHRPPIRHQKEKFQTPIHRGSRKKRTMVPSSLLESPSRRSPRKMLASHRTQESTSSTATILSQTSVSIPPSRNTHRLSNQSLASGVPASAFSSLPSSPQSAYRGSSIFDRVDHDFESSRPTSPESSGISSPVPLPCRGRNPCDASFRASSEPTNLYDKFLASRSARQGEYGVEDCSEIIGDTLDSRDKANEYGISAFSQPPIPEEREESPDENIMNTGAFGPIDKAGGSSPTKHHRVKRSISHESLLSVSGMDIHTLRGRPSQISFSSILAKRPSHIMSTNASLSFSPPVISRTNITVPTSSGSKNRPSELLSSVAAAAATTNSTVTSRSASASTPANRSRSPSNAPSIGKRVGGWVLGKWGVTPTKTSEDGDLPRRPNSKGSSNSSKTVSSVPSNAFSRPSGVNQKGPIPGFRQPEPAPVSVHAETVDERLLKETLQE